MKNYLKFLISMMLTVILIFGNNTYSVNASNLKNIEYNNILDNLTFETIDEINNEIQNIKRNNENISEKELDEIVMNLLFTYGENQIINQKNSFQNSITTFSLPSGYISNLSNLNDKEKELFKARPYKGIRALNLAYNATKLAEQFYISSSLHNGNGDTFRHAYWNGSMVGEIGVDYAKKWGDAHEYYSSGVEKTMDLYNNRIGREIADGLYGKQHFMWSPKLRKAIMDKIDRGYLRIIKNNKIINSNKYEKK